MEGWRFEVPPFVDVVKVNSALAVDVPSENVIFERGRSWSGCKVVVFEAVICRMQIVIR